MKACFFDIDGTLYSHRTWRVTESAVSALRRLRENGIKTVVCTGRSLGALLALPVAEIPFDAYLTLNGQLCYDADRNVFAGTPIPQEDIEILTMVFLAERIPIAMKDEYGAVINVVTDRVVRTQVDADEAVPERGFRTGGSIYQMTAFVNRRQRELLQELLDHCDVTSWHENGIDIVAKGSGKDVGIRRYLEMTGIKREETMAFGDGENDIRMLKYAGTGIAMGNASEAAKAAADYVTSDIDDDGIARALAHFGLL